MKMFFRLCLMLSVAFAGYALAEPENASVQYEVSMSAKAVKDALTSLEGADAFKNAGCGAVAKGKTGIVVTCAKPDAQSDALLRGLLKPGVKIKMSAAKPKAAAAVSCPTGCRWSTSCDPLGACCKITAPAQLC